MTEEKSSIDEMFDAEPVRPQRNYSPPPPPANRKKPVVLLLGVGSVVLATLWWLSVLQHDRFYILIENNSMRVERGYYFPVGHGAWSPSRAYKPLDLPRGIRPDKLGAMSIDELDHTLMNLFMSIARTDLKDMADGDLERAEEMIWRAQKLSSVTIGDDRRLLRMLGDVAFRRGLSKMKGILERFDEAVKHFRLSAMRGGETYPDGEKWAVAIEQLKTEFRELALASDMKPEEALGDKVQADPSVPLKVEEPVVPPSAEIAIEVDAGVNLEVSETDVDGGLE